MEWMLYIVAGLFFLVGGVCVASVVIGLPGTWVLLAIALLIEFIDGLYLPDESSTTFAWWLLGTCLGLAVVGEILEFIAGALGAKKAGSSRRGMIGALIGGLVGAILGFGIPVPIVGSLIGAVIGTFIGAIVGELTGQEQATVKGSLTPAMGATVGKILGTLSKLPIAVAVWVALSIAAFVP